jgi:hypothetical protein
MFSNIFETAKCHPQRPLKPQRFALPDDDEAERKILKNL